MSFRSACLVWVAGLLLAAGCASSRGGVGGRAAGPPTPAAARVIADARSFTGVAYRPGGAQPDGFDCSGFVQYLYGQQGIRLPRTAADQFDAGTRVSASRIAPGDLVFFRTSGRRVSHVGVALGDGTFLHAPNVGQRVRVDHLDDSYWSRRFAGARRVTR